ncbi:MAG: hypothetical protein ABDK87_04430 [Atribacterota bacterium]
MRRFVVFLLFLGIVLLLQETRAEEVFFLDATEGKAFAPLANFLQDTLHCNLHSISLSSERKEELMRTLAGQRAYLFVGYNREDFLYFEAWDLKEQKKVLGMVRRTEDAPLLLEGLKHQLPRILGRGKEWKLFFVRQEEGKSSIVLADVEGKRETLLPPPPEGKVETISIASDGQFLFATVSSGNMTSIFRIDLLSRTWQRLSLPEFSDFSPVFFPFRKTVLFLSEREGKRGIYEMNLDGSKQRLLLERANPIQGIGASLTSAFVFSEFRDERWVLTLWDALRKKERTLNFSGNAFYPAFGKQEIFFIGEEEGKYDVYSVSLLEGTTTQLTFDGLPKAYLAVSPDGKRLAFSSEVDAGNWDIVLLDLGEKKPKRFTASWAKETSPVFSPTPMY